MLKAVPVPLTRFIGRHAELRARRELFECHDVRLVTLTGAPGSGKTRLALQFAADVPNRLGHDITFVDLSPVSDPALVVPTVARSLGVAYAAERTYPDLIVAFETSPRSGRRSSRAPRARP